MHQGILKEKDYLVEELDKMKRLLGLKTEELSQARIEQSANLEEMLRKNSDILKRLGAS